MRTLPARPALPSKTGKRLRKETASIIASANPKETAERRYASARSSRWFADVVSKLKSMAGCGEPCILCDANEATDVEHYRPKSVFPEQTFVWENLLWGCAACNRFKSNRFPPDTEPGARIINPVEDCVWDFFFIDRFGILTPIWRPALDGYDPRAVSTRQILRLDRQTLQERRLHRVKALRQEVEDTIARFRSRHIATDEVRERLRQWKEQPFQPDVADYFLNGPGKREEPFATLLSLTGC